MTELLEAGRLETAQRIGNLCRELYAIAIEGTFGRDAANRDPAQKAVVVGRMADAMERGLRKTI